MNKYERDALDRHITGNWGEDQFPAHEHLDSEEVAREKIMSICTLYDLDRYVRHLEVQYEVIVDVNWNEEIEKLQRFTRILQQAVDRWDEIAIADDQTLQKKGG